MEQNGPCYSLPWQEKRQLKVKWYLLRSTVIERLWTQRPWLHSLTILWNRKSQPQHETRFSFFLFLEISQFKCLLNQPRKKKKAFPALSKPEWKALCSSGCWVCKNKCTLHQANHLSPQTKIKLILTEKHLKDKTVNANEKGLLHS